MLETSLDEHVLSDRGETSDTKTGKADILTCIGRGKPNFLPAWEVKSVSYRDYRLDEPLENLLRISWSSTPLIHEDFLSASPLNASEREIIQQRVGNMCILPPDWRLNLDFQNHVLRGKRIFGNGGSIDNDTLDHIEQRHRALDAINLSFRIVEIGDKGSHLFYTGDLNLVTSWDVYFPETTMQVTRGLMPNYRSIFEALRWKRIM